VADVASVDGTLRRQLNKQTSLLLLLCSEIQNEMKVELTEKLYRSLVHKRLAFALRMQLKATVQRQLTAFYAFAAGHCWQRHCFRAVSFIVYPSIHTDRSYYQNISRTP